MERISLLVVSFALFSLGAYEVVTWPTWGLNGTPLFLLLGQTFRHIYAATELFAATLFAIFGIFGIYFVAAGPESRHTGQFERVLLYPLSMLFFSSCAFLFLGSELLASNAYFEQALATIWKWRWKSGKKSALAVIEDEWLCCGWDSTRRYTAAPHCQQHRKDVEALFTCDAVVMYFSGKPIYRQGLLLALVSFLLLTLMLLLIWLHRDDPVTRDIEEAEALEERRRKLYTGHCPAIQLE